MYRYYNAQAFPSQFRNIHGGLSPIGTGSVGAAPNYEVQPRILRDYHFVYVHAGEGSLKVLGKTFPLQKHDLFLLYPDVVHAYATDPQNLLEMYWIGFNGTDVENMLHLSHFSLQKPVFHPAQWEGLDEIITQMEADSKENRPSNFWSLCGDLYKLFAVLIKMRTEDEPWANSIQQLSSTVNEAQNFINIHYPQAISVSDVANHVGVSRTTLAKWFQRELGKTPSQYLTYVRLQQAAHLLMHTELSVTEVAHSAGYTDALYFSRVFSKCYGCSPMIFRKEKGSTWKPFL